MLLCHRAKSHPHMPPTAAKNRRYNEVRSRKLAGQERPVLFCAHASTCFRLIAFDMENFPPLAEPSHSASQSLNSGPALSIFYLMFLISWRGRHAAGFAAHSRLSSMASILVIATWLRERLTPRQNSS